MRIIAAKTAMVALAALLSALSAFGQTAAKKTGKDMRNGFESVPKRALVELKAAVGKPIDTGLVFVNGKYMPPPYKVERYGTAIRINGMQVSNQVVPWDEFVKTQSGAKVEKTVEGGEDEDEEEEEEETEEEEEEEEESVDDEDDFDDDIDDLFDDVPAAKKDSGPAKGGKSTLATSKKAKARKPVEVVTVTLEGEFKPNEKSNGLLAKINKERTEIDMLLREGGYVCFGRSYRRVSGDSRPAGEILSKLPGIMKANSDYAKFAAAMRENSLSYLTGPVIEDLFRNRIDYLQLAKRARDEKETKEWEKMAGGGR